LQNSPLFVGHPLHYTQSLLHRHTDLVGQAKLIETIKEKKTNTSNNINWKPETFFINILTSKLPKSAKELILSHRKIILSPINNTITKKVPSTKHMLVFI